jgi:hypothetical protein
MQSREAGAIQEAHKAGRTEYAYMFSLMHCGMLALGTVGLGTVGTVDV